MWWLSGPQDLHRIEDRLSTVYVERSHIDRDDNAVVLVNKQRTVRIPAALVATVLVGPGTRITHGAIRLLADSGTTVCWVGERGVRMYAAGLGPSRGSELLMRQAYLVTRTKERLGVARRMYSMRFSDDDVSTATMQQLRGKEGARVKRLYREHSKRTGVAWSGREYRAGEPFAAGDDVNRLLSAGHACLYGICHAAIVGIGASPALGFVHTGSANSFVLDIADLYKADYTIPLAFDLAARGHLTERDARTAFRDRVADGALMGQIIRDIKSLLLEPGSEASEQDWNHLWDGQSGTVAGGVNWASDLADGWDTESFVGITGPETGEAEVPF
ncbi:type I-E CRISPR-associated endonuclease Cas1e [Pseudonocardia sp.]|uniref:type I-E CRISPR-associated endonuclease Cas1e n=1 Tax=Pseudonocardia sp. TaxID=60912 RepID=UPI0026299E93|nr:type I-E CRISPR-associated endonuclease Cas1e [Pseudonocardia sp.]MCW2723077.1 CRISPR-associated protein Cas1 family [Pseudonocardia sp.]